MTELKTSQCFNASIDFLNSYLCYTYALYVSFLSYSMSSNALESLADDVIPINTDATRY